MWSGVPGGDPLVLEWKSPAHVHWTVSPTWMLTFAGANVNVPFGPTATVVVDAAAAPASASRTPAPTTTTLKARPMWNPPAGWLGLSQFQTALPARSFPPAPKKSARRLAAVAAAHARPAAAPLASAVAAAALLVGCGSSASHQPYRAGAAASALQGAVISPVQPAPALALSSYRSQSVSLASLRGKAVFVTFVYTHCADVCPLIVTSLAAAYHALPAATAARVRILAVTVDPRRDTPAAISAFLASRGATGAIDYLIGSLSQLVPTWQRWHIAVAINGHTVSVGHTAIVFGITASGQLKTVYPPQFSPAQIEHDAPLLAAS